MDSHIRVKQQRKHTKAILDSLAFLFVMWPSVKTSPLVRPLGVVVGRVVLGPPNAMGFVVLLGHLMVTVALTVLYGAFPGAICGLPST